MYVKHTGTDGNTVRVDFFFTDCSNNTIGLYKRVGGLKLPKSKGIDKLRIAALNSIAHTLQGIFRKLFCKLKDISPVHRFVRQCLID